MTLSPLFTHAQADVYSFGVTLWEMVERRRPFESYDSLQICALWISDPSQLVLPQLSVPECVLIGGSSSADAHAFVALQQLVNECTAFDPQLRPSFKQVLDRVKRIQRMYDPAVTAAASGGGGGNTARAAGEGCAAAAANVAVLLAEGVLRPGAAAPLQQHAGPGTSAGGVTLGRQHSAPVQQLEAAAASCGSSGGAQQTAARPPLGRGPQRRPSGGGLHQRGSGGGGSGGGAPPPSGAPAGAAGVR